MLINNYQKYLLNVYQPLPVDFKKGKGVWLFDKKSNKYLDLISGLGVTVLGHNHPIIVKSITKQIVKLLHISNMVPISQQADLAKLLINLSGFKNGKAFFCNSGTEAIEAIIKLTRLYAHSKHISNPKIIVMERSFHGRTFAALSATDNPEIKQGFEPLLDGFIKVPFNDLSALQKLANSNQAKEIVAVLLEPIQGEGGIRIPDHDYLKSIRKICSQNQWLMILDEIQTGIGRTGKLFCYQHYGIIPDAIAIAKGLANGLPIGACLIQQPFADLFKPRSHGSTFGGNPLVCSTAITTLHEIIKNNLLENATICGNYFVNKLQEALVNNPNVVAIRGKGLMIGIELNKPCNHIIMPMALKHGLFLNVTRKTIIRLLPPLILKKKHIDLAVAKISFIIKKLQII